MPTSEPELRAALDLVRSDDNLLDPLLANFGELRFLPDDPVLHCASLRARKRTGDGGVVVHFSPARRMLKVLAQFGSGTSTTLTYQLRMYRVDAPRPRS